MVNQDNILKDLSLSLETLDANRLLGMSASSYTDIENKCANYLKFLGYKVAKRPNIKSIIKTEDLISYFYSLLEFYHGEVCTLTTNKSKDLVLVSRFINFRQEDLQCSTKAAIADCATIINTLIVNEKELGLDRPIGLWVFGTAKCKWITDKAISLLNNNYKKYSEDVMARRAQEWSKLDAESYVGIDMVSILKKRGIND